MQPTLKLRAKPQSSFLQDYQLERKYLLLSNKQKGAPALREGTDNDENPVLIKIWPRVPGSDDSDLREIWRNEVRQLHRLSGHPGASDYIVELRTTHEDDLGFYVVLNTGHRRPLDKFMGDDEGNGRRAIPKPFRERRLLWANLRRIALGLEILHSQGLLHRNLTSWSVLTTCGDEPDFQLTGFEWSMRLVSSHDTPGGRKVGGHISDSHSFIHDWQDFGHLVSLLLGLGPKIKNRAIANHDVSEALTVAEIKFVRQLLQVTPTERVDGHFVVAQIDRISTILDALARGREPKFNLVISLGQQSPLAQRIREASNGEIEMADQTAQRAFVEADLFNPTLISQKVPGHPGKFSLVLRGQYLSYQLNDYTSGPEKTPSNWNAAACFRADLNMPLFNNIIKSMPLSFQAINLTTPSEMKSNHAKIRERFTSWEELRKHLRPTAESATKERTLRKAFALTQMLEYLFAASELFPVEVVKSPRPDKKIFGSQNVLALRARADSNRDRLAQALGLREVLAVRLKKALEEDQTEHDGSRTQSWRLTDSSILGGRSETSTEWKFHSVIISEVGEALYTFVGEQPPPQIEDAYLISDDSVGTHEQFLRRMRSFKALSEHGELSAMLIDPRSRVLHSEEEVTAFPQFSELDDSKQKAFKATVETVPLFLVQGPPGVGKTRLVRELVRYTLEGDKSSRLLLSAQSNHAVDHLLHEIEGLIPEKSAAGPLIVRCRARERKDEMSPFDIGQQSKHLVSELMNSDLYANASSQLKGRIAQLGESYGLNGAEENWVALPQHSKLSRRALEGLVLRAANLVFATTNSADLGRLIEEKGQFDWSIVEEAGKATGGELISPLLLSHRRLMIGDHRQLPPFGAERLLALLEKPKGVSGALKLGDPMIGRIFRDPTVDEVFSDVEDSTDEGEQAFAALCEESSRMFSLFETIIEDEFERQQRPKAGRPIAMPLTSQHRMHPAIAKIVSRAFYQGILKTDPMQETRFVTGDSPIISSDRRRLPDSPIVWVDMPWVQNTMNMKEGESYPRYTNELECKAIKHVLDLLDVCPRAGRTPSISILSPYSRQVAKLNRITDGGDNIPTSLQKFSRAAKQKTFGSTVDSFQGSEADCVVISLVRNNNLGTVSSALGFLADPRRMNVLLSRARWKMIVVGSLDFLSAINKSPKSVEDTNRMQFLSTMLDDIKLNANGDISILRYEDLVRNVK